MRVTDKLVESYVNCRTKAYLKITRKTGLLTQFENEIQTLVKEKEEAYYETISMNSKVKHLPDISFLTLDHLKKGYHYLCNVTAKSESLLARITAIQRIPQPSIIGGFSYIPISVSPTRKVGRTDKILLAYKSILLGNLQNKQPEFGRVLTDYSWNPPRIRLTSLIQKTDDLICEIFKLNDDQKRPSLTLNEHCDICEYKQSCYKRAKKADDLSLLKTMKKMEIIKLNNKGIFTVKQLSYTFRPKRKIKKSKKNSERHFHSLKALAIRNNKIYIYKRPQIPTAKFKIYLDVEGDPGRDFYYLIGLVVDDGNSIEKLSFWADEEKDSAGCITAFLNAIQQYENKQIYHYGSYEKTFSRYMSKQIGGTDGVLLDEIFDSSENILTTIYSRIYFPTYGNDLKQIANYLGFNWSIKNVSGIQSIVWRLIWERNRNQSIKDNLLVYNIEDCLALRHLTRFLFAISDRNLLREDIFPNANVTDNFEPQIFARYGNRNFGKPRFFLENFDYINKCAYFDYQKSKIQIKSKKSVKKSPPALKKIRKTGYKVNKEIDIHHSKVCPLCRSQEIRILGKKKLHSKVVIDLKFFEGGVKRWVTKYKANYQHCLSCEKYSFPLTYKRIRRKYGHYLIRWVIYQHMVNMVSFRKISQTLADNFGLFIEGNCLYEFKSRLANYYKQTYNRMAFQIPNWHTMHADETSVRILGEKGYIWVFTNMNDVVFQYTETKKTDFISELIRGFNGVFISDFYVGFNSLKCAQQKCLIHLIRDINKDLFKNQLDGDLQFIANEFSLLLRKIIVTIDRYGLKKRHLYKHKKDVHKFYKNVISKTYKSELALALVKRFKKCDENLFTFLSYDAVPWNNTYGENAFKHFALFRRSVNGVFTEKGIKNYLILLSIYQSCKYRNINFFKFLLSRETNIEKYLEEYTPLGNKRRKG